MESKKFRKNMGKVDRTIRMVVAFVFALFYVFDVIHGALGFVMMLLSALFVLTGSLGYCFLYPIFKLDTTKSGK